jgi:hypothetical protein
MRARLGGLLMFLSGAVACGSNQDLDLDSIWKNPERPEAERQTEAVPLQKGAVHVLWFGHSLLKAPGDEADQEPALDIPALLADIHRLAIDDGRTEIPEGRSVGFAEGPHDLGYWVDGPGRAREKLQQYAEVPWTYVVGVGFMHLLGEGSFEHPSLFHWLGKLMPSRYDSPRRHTANKYAFIRELRETLPEATWVNYVGPALANNVAPQSRINARFECIRRAAEKAGTAVLNAPVGPAFRAAERAAAERPALPIQLQKEDFLHLTPQGGYLAACVFYETLYGVSAQGLPLPARYVGKLAPANEAEVASFLADIAHETVAGYQATCSAEDLLPEDARGASMLELASAK